MRLIKRVNAILTAQLNDIVDTFEKPERMLKQAIREMEAALESAIESTAKAIAAEKRLRRERSDAQAQAETWHGRAVQLVQKGDDVAARHALARKAEKQKSAETLEPAAASNRKRQRAGCGGSSTSFAGDWPTRSGTWRRSSRGSARPKRDGNSCRRSDISTRISRRSAASKTLSERIDETEAEVDARCELQGADFDDASPDPQVESELATLKQQSAAINGPHSSIRGGSS